MGRRKKRRKRRRKIKPFKVMLMFLKSVFLVLFKVLPYAASAVLIFFAFVGIRNYLYADSHFAVRDIIYETDGCVNRQEVLPSGNFYRGFNILRIDLERAERRLDKNSRIKRLAVKRVLPDKLVISVEERKDFFRVMPRMSSSFFCVDRNGYVLSKRSDIDYASVPILENAFTGTQYLDPGDRIRSEEFRNAVRLVDRISGNKHLRDEKVDRIKISKAGDYTVFFDDGLAIKLSREYRKDLAKLGRIAPLLMGPGERKSLEYIDLRFRDPTIRKK